MQAVVRLKVLSSDERARMLYEAQLKERRDNRAREKGAWQEGEKNAAIAIAKRMLNRNRPIDEVVEDTGLSYDEIEGLLNA